MRHKRQHLLLAYLISYFNSHARIGRDAICKHMQKRCKNFNSHARVGRDQGVVAVPGCTNDNFNSHARVGRDNRLHQMGAQTANFNSHARVGRDTVTSSISPLVLISTHTPA